MNIRLTFGNVGGAILGAAGWLADPNHSTVIASIVPSKLSTPLLAVAGIVLWFSHSVKPSDVSLAGVPAPDKTTLGPITFQKTGILKSTPSSTSTL